MTQNTMSASPGVNALPDGTAITGDDERASQARHVCRVMAEYGLLSWRDILNERVEVAFAESDPEELRAKLLQGAAVIAEWVLDLDRRSGRVA